MPRFSNVSRTRKIATIVGVVALVGGGIALATGVSNAAESCAGLDQALQNNLNFIAGQKANPDAQSNARIANRQAVVDLIQQRRQAAGCNGNVQAQQPAAGNNQARAGSGESCAGLDQALANNQNFIAAQRANPDAQSNARIANRQAVVDLIQQRRAAAGCTGDNAPAEEEAEAPAEEAPAEEAPAQEEEEAEEADDNAGGNTGGAGQQICQGSTVTTTGSGGNGALSNQFPVGTKVRVTNLDNNASIETEVVGGSGSCMLLNEGSFAPLRAFANNQLIRRALIEQL